MKAMPRCLPKKREYRTIFFVHEDDIEYTKRKMELRGWTFKNKFRKHGFKFHLKFWRQM